MPELSIKRDGVLARWPDGRCDFLTLWECVGLYFGRVPRRATPTSGGTDNG